jgi:cation diffusion facilitator family transporter
MSPSDYPQIDNLTINLLLVTLLINFGVWFYESRMATRLGSYLLKADAAHTFSDILVTISILASLFFISHGCLWLDPILGLLIALLIFKSAFEILKATIPMLVDEAWLQPDDVEDLVLDVAKVIGFENFKSRRNHKDFFIEMTVSFDTDSLTEAHNLSHQIVANIKDKFGARTQVIIHLEPK